MISIRRSSKKDLPAVMDFIATHWQIDHVLAKNRSLMVWQHCYEDECNYILATDEDVLVGVLGYIPSRRFDDELSTKSNSTDSFYLDSSINKNKDRKSFISLN